MAAAAGLSPAGDGLGCELTSVWLQPADVSTISWSNFATVVLRAAAATGDSEKISISLIYLCPGSNLLDSWTGEAGG